MASSLAAACVPSTFNGLSIFGTNILSIDAAVVTNYTASVPAEARFTQPATEVRDATFCNVTVSYTHPGQNDNIIVETWLPLENPVWNGRLQAVGGSGWSAGRIPVSYLGMAGAIGDGFATSTTDAGMGDGQNVVGLALASPGNINWYTLNNFASVALGEQAVISKALIRSFYARPPSFSYWNGCSQGGRQGMMLAQRYPGAYDGIAAGSPILWTSRVGMALYWPQQVMHQLGSGAYPRGCEIDALSAAAVAACDGLDGVVDGIVAEPVECLRRFDPFRLVGTVVKGCVSAPGNETVKVSKAAAAVVNATWHGIVSAEGKPLWHGVDPGADLVLQGSGPNAIPGVAATDCSSGTCVGVPSQLAMLWLSIYLARADPTFNPGNLTHAEFDDLFHTGRQIYGSAVDTDDPDLSRFRDAGGKMVSFHGLYDGQAASGATRQYYQEVEALLPDAHKFYRHFEVPGLGHCSGRLSGQPTDLFTQLRAWVETGVTPEQTPVNVTVHGGTVQSRILCPYPQSAKFDKTRCQSSTSADASCWSCVSGPARGVKIQAWMAQARAYFGI